MVGSSTARAAEVGKAHRGEALGKRRVRADGDDPAAGRRLRGAERACGVVGRGLGQGAARQRRVPATEGDRRRQKGTEGGYHCTCWSRTYSGCGWVRTFQSGTTSTGGSSHSRGPRAGLIRGGSVGSAMLGENPPHGGGLGDEGDDAHSVRYRLDCRRSCSHGQRPQRVVCRPGPAIRRSPGSETWNRVHGHPRTAPDLSLDRPAPGLGLAATRADWARRKQGLFRPAFGREAPAPSPQQWKLQLPETCQATGDHVAGKSVAAGRDSHPNRRNSLKRPIAGACPQLAALVAMRSSACVRRSLCQGSVVPGATRVSSSFSTSQGNVWM